MPTKPLMTFESPAGESLLFSSLRGTAELGRPYQYEVTLLSRNPAIDLRTLIGKKVAVELALSTGARRRFDGYVTRFTQTGTRGRYHVYQASLRPWLWLMSRRTNSRIFQGTLQDIVKTLIDDPAYRKIDFGAGTHWQIDHRVLPEREFCVQYRESDFNFISRLLEDEGVHYWFGDEDGKEKLLFADNLSAHEEVEGYERLPFARLQDDAEVIHEWRPEMKLRTPAARLVDYDFSNPPPFEAESEFRMPLDRQHLDADVQLEDFEDLELFDYPGGFTDSEHGGSRATARVDEADADWYRMVGETNARGLAVGGKFRLERHPRSEQNDEYVVTRAEYELDFADYEGLDDSAQVTRYTCRFDALPTFRPYAPARSTRKPIVQGPQTAIVVGPDGDEIHTDEHGRVKIHFMWDRLSKHNQDSSCYVRVSHPWAGNQWGMIALPRIGQEVIVDFLEGDPDHPIITGRVYNAANMPPYPLPANKTQTGIKTRSTPDGTIENFNEIRFEDKKGEEQVYIHAERNMDTKVEADSSLSVDAHRTVTVGKTRTTTIKGDTDKLYVNGKHHVEVDKGEDYTVKEGGQVIRVNSGGQYLGSKSGKQELYTDTGQQVTVLGSEGQKVYVQGGQGVTVADGDALLFVNGHDRKVGAKNITHVSTEGDITGVANATYFAQGANMKFKSKGEILFACDGDFKVMNGGSYSVTNTGPASATKLGSWTDLTVAIGNTTSLALTNTTSLGLSNTTFMGLKLDSAMSISFGVKLAVDLSNSLVALDRAGLKTELATVKLINGGASAVTPAAAATGPFTGWGIASIVGSVVSGAAGYFNSFVAGAALANGALDNSDGTNAYQAAWEKASNSVAEGFFPTITAPPAPPAPLPGADSLPALDPGSMGSDMSSSAPSAGAPR